MAETTTIRLPPKLRARVRSFILEAVERYAAYEEEMRNLVKEALAADADIERTGEVYRAADVHAWVDRLTKGEAPRPKPWQR